MDKKSLLSTTRGLATRCSEAGINPFDLLSWVHLLQLRERYVSGSDFVDLDLHYSVSMELDKALVRKARLLDEEAGIDFYVSQIQTLKTIDGYLLLEAF